MIKKAKNSITITMVACILLQTPHTQAMEAYDQPDLNESLGQKFSRWGSSVWNTAQSYIPSKSYLPATLSGLIQVPLLYESGLRFPSESQFLVHNAMSGLLTAPLITRAQSQERFQQKPSERAHWGWYFAPAATNILLGAALGSRGLVGGGSSAYKARIGALASAVANTPGALYALYLAARENQDKQNFDNFMQAENDLLNFLSDIFTNRLVVDSSLANALMHDLIEKYDTTKALIPDSWLLDTQKISARALIERELLTRLVNMKAIVLSTSDDINFIYVIIDPNLKNNILQSFPYYIHHNELANNGFNQDVINYVGQILTNAPITSRRLDEIFYPLATE